MSAFVCVSALFLVAVAKAEYNYTSGPIAAPHLPFSSINYKQPENRVNPINNLHYSTSHYNIPQNNAIHYSNPQVNAAHLYDAPQVNQPQYNPQESLHFSTPQVGGSHYEAPGVQTHEAPLITKQFYVHSAPEDHSSIHKKKHIIIGRPQKNYRVIFIKNPSETKSNVHLSAEIAPQEEKTIIYVLSQKDTSLAIDNIATPAPTQPSKPEVFFIKYKTPEEAIFAQHEIQRQYDVLGGETQVSDEGQAPVSSVIGSLNTRVSNHPLNTLGNEYLPAHKV